MPSVCGPSANVVPAGVTVGVGATPGSAARGPGVGLPEPPQPPVTSASRQAAAVRRGRRDTDGLQGGGVGTGTGPP